jgi:hypothetical protein
MRRQRVARLFLVVLLLLAPGAHPPSSGAAGPADARNVELVGRLDIEGGGMVDVQGHLAVIGHMAPPHATSLLDVSDPVRPTLLARIPTTPGTHSHKARLCGSVLITNHERYGGWGPGSRVGLGLFDVSDPRRPKEIGFLEMGGRSGGGTGVHRFEADCSRKLVYAGAGLEGYQGNVTLIVDFSDPRNPIEVSRWWMPGQWTAGGEKSAAGVGYRTHHPNRMGDRLYVPLWMGGVAIVDIADIANPKTVSHLNYSRPSGAPTHTTLPVPHLIQGHRWLVVFDEDLGGGCDRPAGMWMLDITDETRPVVTAEFQPPRPARCEGRSGAHQPHEKVGRDNLVYAAWFSRGLRVIDISIPARPVEVGHYLPHFAKGRPPLSNDVFVDHRGLIYLIDRDNGLDILRFTGRPSGS